MKKAVRADLLTSDPEDGGDRNPKRPFDEVDLSYPIILDRDGRVMDGIHRVCKAIREGKDKVPAVRFVTNPEPDFIGCDPNELPYDD